MGEDRLPQLHRHSHKPALALRGGTLSGTQTRRSAIAKCCRRPDQPDGRAPSGLEQVTPVRLAPLAPTRSKPVR